MKTILITGVSRGIGYALAKRFLENGDFVIGTSINGSVDLKSENFVVFSLDLSKSNSIKECADKIVALGRKIDIHINNAGIVIEKEVSQQKINIDYLRETLEVNLIGTIDFTERVIDLLNDNGHLINISSRAGSLGYDKYTLNYPDYRISKTALNMVTKILALRLKGKATVSSVHPGWVKTDMGGDEADITPKEAAEDIFKLANSEAETGQFWFKGERFPW